jgi:hypothetical protein
MEAEPQKRNPLKVWQMFSVSLFGKQGILIIN